MTTKRKSGLAVAWYRAALPVIVSFLLVIGSSRANAQPLPAQPNIANGQAGFMDDLPFDPIAPLSLYGGCVLVLDAKDQCKSPARGATGGAHINLSLAPWQAQIYAQTQASEYDRATLATFPLWELNHHCGGVLIAPNWVLTAAHCIDPATQVGARRPDDTLARMKSGAFRVRLGTDNIASQGGATFRLEHIIVHAGYNKTSLANDIALIAIDPAQQSGGYQIGSVQPITLNFQPPRGMGLGPFAPVFATGWGYTSNLGRASDQLKQVLLGRVPGHLCAQVRPGLHVDAPVICAMAPGTDTCRGDSGGPLTADMVDPVTRQRARILIGIVSTGPPCGEARGRPGIYTRISRYADWIERAQAASRSVQGGMQVLRVR